MHIAVTWDISASGNRWKEINDQMREVLRPFSWVRPLTTFFVVRVSGRGDQDSIRNGLLAVAKSVSEQVHFVVSPIMSPGRYDGYLPKDMWAELNQRTS